ncbi:MAG: tetratricopeptide repeat protein [Bacteroidia bacterium]|nr:tetratricopeptide repeat protein [Bacteroidia bacterium]MDW8088239.1 tetratricopeptide repeat protein [Bacteroidia bacterium]
MRRGWLFGIVLSLAAQDPRAAVALFREGKYEEAYPVFKRLFDKNRDYLWGSYAVECLLRLERWGEYQRWLQAERSRYRTSPWASAWELRQRSWRGDTLAFREWQNFLRRSDLTIQLLEDLAEVAATVWESPSWQWAALITARQQHPLPAAYAEAIILYYENERKLGQAWEEWVYLWKVRSLPVDTLLQVLARYFASGLSPEEAEIPLLRVWQEVPTASVAYLLAHLYLRAENLREALRFARAAFRLDRDCRSLYEVGWLAHEKGLFSVAAEAFRYLIQIGEACPYYPLALQRYLQVEALLQQPERALTAIDSLLRSAGDSTLLLLEKARWLLQTARAPQAAALLRPLQPTAPAHIVQKNLLLSEAALAENDFIQARLYLLEIESRFPQSTWLSEVYFHLARLAYFQGEFELAKTRLRLLKNNTQDDLSNDAIQLFWHIEDNLKPDTLPAPLQLYARAELSFRQGRSAEALRYLDSLERAYRGHPITDDVLWLRAQHYLGQKDTLQARTYLQLLADYPDSESLYRDDALYLLAQFSRTPHEALRYYERLLRETPGTLYARLAQEKLRAWSH